MDVKCLIFFFLFVLINCNGLNNRPSLLNLLLNRQTSHSSELKATVCDPAQSRCGGFVSCSVGYCDYQDRLCKPILYLPEGSKCELYDNCLTGNCIKNGKESYCQEPVNFFCPCNNSEVDYKSDDKCITTYCSSNHCDYDRYPGEPCVENYHCLTKKCDKGICVGAHSGAKCKFYFDCDKGLFCSDASGICKPLSKLNEHCQYAKQFCIPNTYCDPKTNTCQVTHSMPAGSPCNLLNSESCQISTFCSFETNKCESRSTLTDIDCSDNSFVCEYPFHTCACVGKSSLCVQKLNFNCDVEVLDMVKCFTEKCPYYYDDQYLHYGIKNCLTTECGDYLAKAFCCETSFTESDYQTYFKNVYGKFIDCKNKNMKYSPCIDLF